MFEKKVKSESKKYEEEGCLWKLKKAIENKWGDMKFDIVVGNPPYGKDGNGSNKKLHFQIFNTALTFVKDNGCANFIMPSKCLYDMNMDWERNLLKKAVCTDILVQNKLTFGGTKMAETAIYFCKKDSGSKHSSKLDIQDVFDNSLNSTEKKYVRYFNVGNIFKKTFTYKVKSGEARKYSNVDEYINYVISNKLNNSYYLNMCYASGNFTGTYTPGYYISPEQVKKGFLSLEQQKEYISDNRKSKRWIGFEDEKYGINLLTLIQKPIMRFGLWLVQDTYTMEGKCYKYFPDIDYSDIDTDEKLLDKLGCTDPKEQKEILDYVNNFDFTQKRNDRFLKGEESEYDQSPSTSTSNSLPKTIYGLKLKRLDPSSDIPDDEKYNEEDLKNAYPDQYEKLEK